MNYRNTWAYYQKGFCVISSKINDFELKEQNKTLFCSIGVGRQNLKPFNRKKIKGLHYIMILSNFTAV